MIHIKDYIKKPKTSSHQTVHDSKPISDNLVPFENEDKISKEYIGRFVDKLMKMPDDLHHEITRNQDDSIDSTEFVASRILAEEKW